MSVYSIIVIPSHLACHQFTCGLSLCCGRTAHLSRDDIQAVVNNYRNPVSTSTVHVPIPMLNCVMVDIILANPPRMVECATRSSVT